MRFLCLHGRGTNGRILEIQTARLRHSLGPDHEFVFVDGRVPWQPAPEINDIASGDDEFFRYVLETEPSVFAKFRSDITEFIRTEGPFEGILGFSEGGGLAAGMIADQIEGLNPEFKFKCAILFCAIEFLLVHVPQRHRLEMLRSDFNTKVPSIPMAHVWDPNDTVFPPFDSVFEGICEESVAEKVRHDLGHEIPGRSGNSQFLAKTVRAIERTIERAEMGM